MNDFLFDIANLKLDQLGYVFKDIRKQAKIMKSIYNMPQFGFIEGNLQEFYYRGKKSTASATIGFSRMGNLQIELIQWHEGDCIYKEFLDEGREGLQHVSYFVKGLHDYVEDFNKKGIEVIQSGILLDRHYFYLDTEKTFGTIIELQETISRRRKKKT